MTVSELVDVDLFSTRKVTAAIGAEITGLDLTRTQSSKIQADLVEALAEHQVLFFRNQNLNEDQQLSVARIFGQPVVTVIARKMGAENYLSVIEDNDKHRPDRDSWHSDVTFAENPPSIGILKSVVVPSYGGDTIWASLYGAYDLLSEPMKELVAKLELRHWTGTDMLDLIRIRRGEGMATKVREDFPGAVHPLVIRNPIGGRKALYLSERFTDCVVGMSRKESEHILSYLHRLLDTPEIQVRWTWKPNDIAVWDERTTNHRGVADHFPQHRVIVRAEADRDPPGAWAAN